MIAKGEVILIYVTKGQTDEGSPIQTDFNKKVTCDVIKTFSNNYYMNLGRTMRGAVNLVVNEYNTHDVVIDDNVYQLTYAIFRGKKYKVENILNNIRNKQDDPFRKVLDLKQVT